MFDPSALNCNSIVNNQFSFLDEQMNTYTFRYKSIKSVKIKINRWNNKNRFLPIYRLINRYRFLSIGYSGNGGHLRKFSPRRSLIRRPWIKQTCQHLRYKYTKKMKSRDLPLFKLLPRPVAGISNYKLRKNSEKFLLFNDSTTCRTERADSFLTFRYFK